MKTAFLLLLATVVNSAGSLLAAQTPESGNGAPRYSFLDPIGDFARDSVLRPIHPFEMVPGKDPNGWAFSIEPYLWATALSGTIQVPPGPAVSVGVKPKSVLQNLNWGVMAMAEARKGRWGLLFDGFYAELSGSRSLEGNLYSSGSMEIQQAFSSLALAYRIIDDRRGFLDLYVGTRYNYMGTEASFTTNTAGIQGVSDAIVNNLQSDIAGQIRAALAADSEGTAESIAARVQSGLRGRALERLADVERSPENLLKLKVLGRVLNGNRNLINDVVSAIAAERVAAAQGKISSTLRARTEAAKAKLTKQLAKSIENELTTSASGADWWFDPIVGFRGQINFTRWLYLTTQGDVGGFGVGSQIAWNALAALGVNFSRNVYAELGYRYMYLDYQNGTIIYKMNQFGIYSSIGVKF